MDEKTTTVANEAQGAYIDEFAESEVYEQSYDVLETIKPTREYKLTLKSVEIALSKSKHLYAVLTKKNGSFSTMFIDRSLKSLPAGTKLSISSIYKERRKYKDTGDVSPVLCGRPLL